MMKASSFIREIDMTFGSWVRVFSAVALAVGALPGWAASPAPASPHVIREISMPGAEGWDYLTFDGSRGRLFVSHGTHVEIVDMRKLAPAGSIADTPGVHGIAIAEDLGRGYVSAGAASSVVVFDLQTLARIAEVRTTGANPDAILYEPVTHRVFTFNGRGQNITALDARTNAVVGTIALHAKPEFAVTDGAGHVFVNLEDTNSLAEIDPAGLTVRHTWPLADCDEPSGLAMDRAHHRLFAVCGNRVMDIVDSTNGRVVAHVPIGEEVDGAGFDPSRQLAYASGGDGTLTVVKEETPDRFSVLETVATKRGARTMAVDEQTHRIFLATAQRNPPPPSTASQPHPRPTVVPGTFEVLVVEP
jgi:DNA-binding beta-propeller fold protein YncE